MAQVGGEGFGLPRDTIQVSHSLTKVRGLRAADSRCFAQPPRCSVASFFFGMLGPAVVSMHVDRRRRGCRRFGAVDGPRWRQDWPRWRPDGPRWPQDGAKMAPRWHQDGPRWAKMAPRWRQDRLKWRQDGARLREVGLKWRQDAPKWRQDGPIWCQDGLEWASRAIISISIRCKCAEVVQL